MSGDSNNDLKVGKRRYNYMENVLQHVITKISVTDEDKKRNNLILNAAIDTLLGKMRETSTLFAKLYRRHFYGGSYYDKIKTGKPDEYDIDLLLVLSKKQVFTLKPIDEAPGFVNLTYSNKETNEVSELFDGEYLCADKVKKWMEGIITKTMLEIPKSGNMNVLNIQGTDFFIKIVKSGPAFTAKLNGQMDGGTHLNFDVDLVPCFIFNESMWPQGRFKNNPVKEKTEFFIVPKTPKDVSCPTNYCWRLSFQEQERVLIHGSRTLKPCVKLIKKLRDKLQQNSISSYFIKTIFMWEVEKQDKTFWENSLSYVFVEMLQVYERHLREHKIPYYWNTDNNLIESLSTTMIENYSNRIKNIVAEINKKSNDPYYIATFFLNDADLEQVKIHQKVEINTNGNGNNGNGSCNESKSKCNCGSNAKVDLDNAIKEMRKEIDEARQEQEANKVEILELLRCVVQRLDDIDAKLS